MLEEIHELKNLPIAKFASNNRNDIDNMWMNLKCRIASAKKNVSDIMGYVLSLCLHAMVVFLGTSML